MQHNVLTPRRCTVTADGDQRLLGVLRGNGGTDDLAVVHGGQAVRDDPAAFILWQHLLLCRDAGVTALTVAALDEMLFPGKLFRLDKDAVFADAAARVRLMQRGVDVPIVESLRHGKFDAFNVRLAGVDAQAVLSLCRGRLAHLQKRDA